MEQSHGSQQDICHEEVKSLLTAGVSSQMCPWYIIMAKHQSVCGVQRAEVRKRLEMEELLEDAIAAKRLRWI